MEDGGDKRQRKGEDDNIISEREDSRKGGRGRGREKTQLKKAWPRLIYTRSERFVGYYSG